MGHASGQAANAGQSLGVGQAISQQTGFGDVFNEDDQAAVAGSQWFLNGRLVQVQLACLAIDTQALLVAVRLALSAELFQQVAPGRFQAAQP